MEHLVQERALTAEATALRTGTLDIVAQATRSCDRIDEVDGALRAFVSEPGRGDRLAAQARSAAERWPDPVDRPALYGVLVGVKDIVRVDGLPTQAGSRLPPEVLHGPQATVVNRLVEAGALVAGKTVTAEFAVLAPGPTRNPHRLTHSPGGSSSGSAAAVAAGLVPLAVGTQTIGSVIRPAAYCGIVGYKPTLGRIPSEGVIDNAPSFDTVGLFTSDVAGMVLAAPQVCDGWRPRTGPARPAVLGVPVGPYLDRADASAREAFQRHTALLRAAGNTVHQVPVMADFATVVKEFLVVNRYELAQTHAAWFPRFSELYRPQTTEAIREGQAIDHDRYLRARKAREDFRERLLSAMSDADIDVWISPSATGPAPHGLATTGASTMNLPWSGAGLPSLTLPAGHSAEGLPLGVQCVAGPGFDEALLDWVSGLEPILADA